jgi:hypothetical protein
MAAGVVELSSLDLAVTYQMGYVWVIQLQNTVECGGPIIIAL